MAGVKTCERRFRDLNDLLASLGTQLIASI